MRPLMGCLIGMGLALGVAGAGPVDGQEELPWRGTGVPEWRVMYGGFEHLDDLAPIDPDTAWAIDQLQTTDGTVFRYQTAFVYRQGDLWRVTQVADGLALAAIAVAGPDTGIAVGRGGAIYRLTGTIWSAMESPVTVDLLDVSLGSADYGWAVGDTGTLLRWDGGGWKRFYLPAEVSFTPVTAVAALPNREAWAVTQGGQVWHSTGGDWALTATPSLRRPADVAFADAGHGLVAGQGMLELRDGQWQLVGQASMSYRSVTWVGTDAYAVANDRLVRYRDGTWSDVELAPGPVSLADLRFERVVGGSGGAWAVATGGTMVWIVDGVAGYLWPPIRQLESVDALTPDVGWVGGQAIEVGFVGSADGRWGLSQAVPQWTVVWDLDLVTATDGWAVGQDPTSLELTRLWRWDGSSWVTWGTDKTWELTRLQMLAADEGWAAGGNVIVRWRGAGWQAVSGMPLGASGSLSVLRGGDVPWAWFGSVGNIFQLQGDEWTVQALDENAEVLALAVPASDVGWAITANTLFEFNGRAWLPKSVPKPLGSIFQDLSAVDASNLWVVLDPPALLHWTGRLWEYHDLSPLGGNAHFNRMRAVTYEAMAGRTDIWLAGSPPTVARYRVVTPESELILPALFKGATYGP